MLPSGVWLNWTAFSGLMWCVAGTAVLYICLDALALNGSLRLWVVYCTGELCVQDAIHLIYVVIAFFQVWLKHQVHSKPIDIQYLYSIYHMGCPIMMFVQFLSLYCRTLWSLYLLISLPCKTSQTYPKLSVGMLAPICSSLAICYQRTAGHQVLASHNETCLIQGRRDPNPHCDSLSKM